MPSKVSMRSGSPCPVSGARGSSPETRIRGLKCRSGYTQDLPFQGVPNKLYRTWCGCARPRHGYWWTRDVMDCWHLCQHNWYVWMHWKHLSIALKLVDLRCFIIFLYWKKAHMSWVQDLVAQLSFIACLVSSILNAVAVTAALRVGHFRVSKLQISEKNSPRLRVRADVQVALS